MTRPTTSLRIGIGGPCAAGSPTHSHGDGHSHTHSHGGDHHHHHDDPHVVDGGGVMVQQWRPHTPPGPNPVLDIGGNIGALVVYLARLTARGELDIQPLGDPAGRFHTGVHRRDGIWVAVFPEVVEGRYELLDDHGRTRAQVVVTGGEVREIDLR
jgi:hypothetical protein